MGIAQAAAATKDAVVGKGLQELANWNVDFGRVRNLKLDSRARRLEIELDLRGESEAVRVVVEDYRLSEGPDGLAIEAGKVTTSREWLTVLAQRFVVGRPWALPVPPAYRWLVTRLL